MNDDIPSAPRLPVIPKAAGKRDAITGPPEDEDLLTLLRDVRKAATNLGDSISKLESKLLMLEMAILTEEHKTHQLREEFEALARYVKERLPPEAAE